MNLVSKDGVCKETRNKAVFAVNPLVESKSTSDKEIGSAIVRHHCDIVSYICWVKGLTSMKLCKEE